MQTFERLREVASSLADDPRARVDLMRVMCAHLVDVRAARPGMDASWYVQRCEAQARQHLGNSPIATGAATGMIVMPPVKPTPDNTPISLTKTTGSAGLLAGLSDRQKEVYHHLHAGRGVRETARLLGISHPAVIKHRRKIEQLLQTAKLA